MEIMKDVRRDRFCTLAFSLSLLYVICLFPVYINDFYVPDMRLYSSFAAQGRAAKDGFSSLFVAIAGLINLWPSGLLICCLLSLAICMFLLAYFYRKLFSKGNWQIDLSVVAMIYSCSIWYYLYGKLFYDFPLTAMNLSIILYSMIGIWNEDTKKTAKWFFLCFFLGLLLSWKPYNIFIFTGLALLMFSVKRGRSIYTQNMGNRKGFLFSSIFLLFGYVIGNFNLLLRPEETIQGLQAYKASYDFSRFLFFKGRIIWDHINALPFQFSSILVSTAVVILFILPIILKKVEYFVIGILMSFCFYFFIRNFSPGYPWHGFPFAVFIILQFIFMSGKAQTNIRKKLFVGLSGLFILLQGITCFTFYIPKQVKWLKITENSIKVCQEQEEEIYKKVNGIIENYGESYCIDLAVKRFTLYAKSPLHLKERKWDSLYVYGDNFVFTDCLQAVDYGSWNRLYKNGQAKVDRTYESLSAKNELDYLIYILPDDFKYLAEAADLNKYSSYEVLEEISGIGYDIMVYKLKK